MNERDELRLRDMLDSSRRALRFSEGKTRQSLEQDEILAYAIVRTLEIIGEAASRVTQETRQLYPDIPWKDVIAMRNRLIHDYLKVEYQIVWDVVTIDLPVLTAQLERILLSETDNE